MIVVHVKRDGVLYELKRYSSNYYYKALDDRGGYRYTTKREIKRRFDLSDSGFARLFGLRVCRSD